MKELGDAVGLSPSILAAGIKNRVALKILENDIRRGMKLNITGTPTFVIDNKTYTGTIPTNILERIIAAD